MNGNIPIQPTPTEYRLVRSTDADAFQGAVNNMLKDGWTFHGPTVISGGEFAQPMIQLEMRPVKMGKMDSSIIPVEGGLLRR